MLKVLIIIDSLFWLVIYGIINIRIRGNIRYYIKNATPTKITIPIKIDFMFIMIFQFKKLKFLKYKYTKAKKSDIVYNAIAYQFTTFVNSGISPVLLFVFVKLENNKSEFHIK